MGRANRSKRFPEALRELEREGLPEGYPEYWYSPREGTIETAEKAPTLSEQILTMSDADLLRDLPSICPDFQATELHLGEILVNPDKNNREYRGKIEIIQNDLGEWVFRGSAQWGRSGQVASGRSQTLYEGDSLDLAERAVNERLSEKANSDYFVPRGDSYRVEQWEARRALEGKILGAIA